MPTKRKPPAKPKGFDERRKKLLLIAGAAAFVIVFALIRRSSSPRVATIPGTDPNVDPATGLSYGQEAAGGLGSGAGGSGVDAGQLDYTPAFSALSTQLDNLSGYVAELGASPFAVAAPASSTTPVAVATPTAPETAPRPPGAAITPASRGAAVHVPASTAPAAYRGGAAVVSVTHPNAKTTITTTKTGAHIEQVAGHSAYRIDRPAAPKTKPAAARSAPKPVAAVKQPKPSKRTKQPVSATAAYHAAKARSNPGGGGL